MGGMQILNARFCVLNLICPTLLFLNIKVGECLGIWWRPDFGTLLYPFLPPNTERPKVIPGAFLLFYVLGAARSS